jgi:uncharacterized membrane protein
MKKILTLLILIGFLGLPVVGLAQPQTVPTNVNPLQVMDRIVDWLFSILLIFAAIMIVVAAFYFVTASGNPDQVAKARNFVIYALIGVLVAFLARGMVWLVGRIVGSAGGGGGIWFNI